MAVAPGADLGGANGSGVTTRVITTGVTVPAGGVIYVEAGSFFVGSITHSIAGGGLTWVQENTGTSGNTRGSIFRAVVPAGLAPLSSITVTFSNACDAVIRAYYYTGVDNATPSRTAGGAASAVAATTTGSLASQAGDAIIAGSWSDGAAASWTPTSPAVERIDVNISAQSETIVMADKVSVSGADSVDGAWNTTTTSFTNGVVAIPDAGTTAVVAVAQRFLPRKLGPRAMGPTFFAPFRSDAAPPAPAVVSSRKRRNFFGIGR